MHTFVSIFSICFRVELNREYRFYPIENVCAFVLAPSVFQTNLAIYNIKLKYKIEINKQYNNRNIK